MVVVVVVASAVVTLASGAAVQLDRLEPVQQAGQVGDAVQRHGVGQASPGDAARAIGQQVPGVDGLGVLLGLLGRFDAFVLDARLRIQPGS